MMISQILFSLLLIGAYANSNPYVFQDGCDDECDGISTAVKTCDVEIPGMDPMNKVCSEKSVKCNTHACDDVVAFGECDQTCEGGIRTRQVQEEVESQMCNSYPCSDAEYDSVCDVDVVFAFDVSSGISEYRFRYGVQVVKDFTHYSPTNMRFSFLSYSTYPDQISSFEDNEEAGAIQANLENMIFTGGASDPLAAFGASINAFDPDRPSKKVLVYVTDNAGFDEENIVKGMAAVAHMDFSFYVLNLGIGNGVNILVKGDPEDYVISSKKFYSPMYLLQNVLMNECSYELAFESPEVLPGQADVLSNMQRLNADTSTTCTDWTEYPECTECGSLYSVKRYQTCTTNGGIGESTTETEYFFCFVVCPTTTLPPPTTTTTTPVPTTTTTPEPTTTTTPEPTTTTKPPPSDEVDCERCDFTRGQIWRPDPKDCQKYYICNRYLNTTTGEYQYESFRMLCGHLFWDQQRLTCVNKRPYDALCELVGNNTYVRDGTTTESPCPFEVVAGSPRLYQRVPFDNYTMDCGQGFEFNNTVCTCLLVGNRDCSDDMLLHFPFTDHFNDVTCKKAHGELHGPGFAEIVYDGELDRDVAYFNGHKRLEVRFMRNWFKDQNITEFSVSVLVKRLVGNYSKVGFVDNGDCEDPSSFRLHGNVDAVTGESIGNGGYTSDGPNVVNTNTNVITYGDWVRLTVTYDGTTVRYYNGNALVDSKALTGAVMNTQNPMTVAMCECMDESVDSGYFKGYMSELRVYTRVIVPPF